MRLITPEKLLEILGELDVSGADSKFIAAGPLESSLATVLTEGYLNLEELARRINQYCSQPGIHSTTKVRSGTA